MREEFNDDNYIHKFFLGDQKGVDKANARKVITEMLENGEIDEKVKDTFFGWIDKYITKIRGGIFKILIDKSKKDLEGKERKTYLDL